MARLVANIPLLKAGLPPLVIVQEQRRSYIQALARYQVHVGQLNLTSTVWPNVEQLKDFEVFCQNTYAATKELIVKAIDVQRKRVTEEA